MARIRGKSTPKTHHNPGKLNYQYLNKELSREIYQKVVKEVFGGKKNRNQYDSNGYRQQYLVDPLNDEEFPPEVIGEFDSIVRNKFGIPIDCRVKATLFYAMRNAKMELEPPDEKVAFRYFANINAKDMFHLECPISIPKGDLTNFGIKDKSTFLPEDVYVSMGPSKLSYYTIKTNPGKWIYANETKTDGTQLHRKIIKPRNYTRLNIILDYYVTLEYGKKLLRESEKIQDNRIREITTQVIQELINEYT